MSALIRGDCGSCVIFYDRFFDEFLVLGTTVSYVLDDFEKFVLPGCINR